HHLHFAEIGVRKAPSKVALSAVPSDDTVNACRAAVSKCAEDGSQCVARYDLGFAKGNRGPAYSDRLEANARCGIHNRIVGSSEECEDGSLPRNGAFGVRTESPTGTDE